MWMHACINCWSACTWLFQNLALNTICLFFSFLFLSFLFLFFLCYDCLWMITMSDIFSIWSCGRCLHCTWWAEAKSWYVHSLLFIILELFYPLKYVYKNQNIRIWCMLYCFIFFPSRVIHPQISTALSSVI
jgi:hypothetical protein